MNYVKNMINHIDYSKFSLLLVAEGFTSAQEQIFYDQVYDIYRRIINYECFTKLKPINNVLNIVSLFMPSANSGTATNPAAAVGNTAFESYIDSGGLHFNYSKIEQVINDTIIIKNDEEYPLSKHLFVNNESVHTGVRSYILPVIIFPDGMTLTGELEFLENNKFYFISTSLDNQYEQIIIRSLAKMVGLGDEFDIDGPEFLEPNEEIGKSINMTFPNLFYTEAASSMTGNSIYFKWMGLFPQGASATIPLHPHPNGGAIADRLLPPIPFSYKPIELWEGGGHYRNNVYRPAIDCLLRRRIGDNSLPVKENRVSLCPICMMYFEKFLNSN